MSSLRTNRLYNRLPDTDFSKFFGGTSKGLKDNPALPNPPVAPADLDLMKATFDELLIAANKGGSLATAKKNAQRAVCADAADKNASYVDINCNDDMTILLSSGYQPVSTNSAQSVLNAPVVVAADYVQAGKIKLRVAGDANRRAILGRYKAIGGEFGPVITFKNSREILFGSLTAGIEYVFQLCGLGGSTGQSDWSEPVSKIAI